jgi:hypothetical protein
MTKEEFGEKMKAIYNNGIFDNEGAHGKADEVIVEALKDLGYDFTDYDKMCDEFWYA